MDNMMDTSDIFPFLIGDEDEEELDEEQDDEDDDEP